MPAILGNSASGFQCFEATQLRGMDLVAHALVTTLGKVLLYRLAHLQQDPRKIDYMPGLDLAHGQLHDQLRITRGVVLHRPLARHLGNLVGLLGGHRLHRPTVGPIDFGSSLGGTGNHCQQQDYNGASERQDHVLHTGKGSLESEPGARNGQ